MQIGWGDHLKYRHLQTGHRAGRTGGQGVWPCLRRKFMSGFSQGVKEREKGHRKRMTDILIGPKKERE